jgi:hypothetical protein
MVLAGTRSNTVHREETEEPTAMSMNKAEQNVPAKDHLVQCHASRSFLFQAPDEASVQVSVAHVAMIATFAVLVDHSYYRIT